MGNVPKMREIFIEKEIDKENFVKLISTIYKNDYYIYTIIPEWEEELFDVLSNDFILIDKINFPLHMIFPETTGVLGFIKNHTKRYVFEFYLRSGTIDFLIFSEFDVSQHLTSVSKEITDFYKLFESNHIPHITIGSDGQWLNVFEY